MAKRLGHAPIDQEREVKATAGLRLFVDGGEGGLCRFPSRRYDAEELLNQEPIGIRNCKVSLKLYLYLKA